MYTLCSNNLCHLCLRSLPSAKFPGSGCNCSYPFKPKKGQLEPTHSQSRMHGPHSTDTDGARRSASSDSCRNLESQGWTNPETGTGGVPFYRWPFQKYQPNFLRLNPLRMSNPTDPGGWTSEPFLGFGISPGSALESVSETV